MIQRTVIGGYRSTWGAEAASLFTSRLTTARTCGDNLLDALRSGAGSSPRQAAGAPT